MMIRLKKEWHIWYFLGMIILILGIFFRVVNLGNKVYWYDETITSLRVAGYTKAELTTEVAMAGFMTPESLQFYQKPHAERNSLQTIRSLAIENPEHPPLYFFLARLWVEWWGHSPTVVRSLSVIFSLLSLPCVYFLCLELFKNSGLAWVGLALMSVSPFQVLYAQEARGYSLLTFNILLSSLGLLRALRHNQALSWFGYAVTVILGLYTQVLFGVVVLGHGLYVLILSRFKLTTQVWNYAWASVCSLLCFLPWMIYIIQYYQGMGWIARSIPVKTWLTRWLINPTLILFDLQITIPDRLFDIVNHQDGFRVAWNNPWTYFLLGLWALMVYALYFLWKNTAASVHWFVLTLIGTTFCILIGPDLISGGQRSSIARYLIPCYLGVQITLAYCLGTHLRTYAKKWQLITGLIISLGILSCAVTTKADTAWNKYSSYYDPKVAEVIAESSTPLIISSNSIRMVSLSYLVPKNAQLIYLEGGVPGNLSGFSDIFLFHPDQSILETLTTDPNYQAELVFPPGSLWKLERK